MAPALTVPGAPAMVPLPMHALPNPVAAPNSPMLLRCLLLLTMFLSTSAGAATRIDLNRGWSFRVESGVDGVQAGWPATLPAVGSGLI